jgi:hypothetical protein
MFSCLQGYICQVCSFHCEDEPEMLTHITSEHGDSPECSENSGSDSAGESELDNESEKESLKNKSRTVSSSLLKYKSHGKTSKLASHDIFVVRVRHAVKWSCDCHSSNSIYNLVW